MTFRCLSKLGFTSIKLGTSALWISLLLGGLHLSKTSYDRQILVVYVAYQSKKPHTLLGGPYSTHASATVRLHNQIRLDMV
jgi:hypothetical protein